MITFEWVKWHLHYWKTIERGGRTIGFEWWQSCASRKWFRWPIGYNHDRNILKNWTVR